MTVRRAFVFGGVLWVSCALFFFFPSLGFTDFPTTQSLVKNIRVGYSPESTRVVFDLERQAIYEHQRLTSPKNHVMITIQDVVLGQEAQQAIVSGAIPHPMTIYSWKGNQVRIDLDLDVMGTFRIFNLKNPHRFVIDLYDLPEKQAHVGPDGLARGRELQEEERRVDKTVQIIVIDPGHGGKDPGASIRKEKLAEKDLVLDIALRLRRIMEDRHDAMIYMTRETDVFVELEDRVALANEKKADLFISIHVNAHSSPEVAGLEVYRFGEAKNPDDLEKAARENRMSIEETKELGLMALVIGIGEKNASSFLSNGKVDNSRNLAWETRNAMSKRLGDKYKLADLGVKTAPFYVLRHTVMSSILAEVAYLTNSSDRKHLVSPKFRQQVAEAIFTGIVDYIETRKGASG